MFEPLDILWIAIVAVGFLVLNQGAKLLTDNAVAVARTSGRSRFVIGMLLVSTLAALPEVLVSIFALQENSPKIAMGNVIASNIVTVSFVIGLSAIVAPLTATREIVLRDAVFLMTFTLVASILLVDGDLTTYEGLALIALFVPYTMNLLIAGKTASDEEMKAAVRDMEAEMFFMGRLFGKRFKTNKGLQWLIFGIAWCVMGAQFVVRASIQLSHGFGIDEWVLGITLVAVGTSLPDIAASYHATKSGYSDLALGEGIGANIVTTLLTLGLMGMFRPTDYGLGTILPMVVAMNVVTLLLVVLMINKWRISRIGGAILMAFYLVAIAVDLIL